MATARVLIVDDEPSVLRLVSKAVAGWGYEVYAVSSALQALRLAHDAAVFRFGYLRCHHAGDVRTGDGQKALTALPERLGRDDVGSYRCRGASSESRVHQ